VRKRGVTPTHAFEHLSCFFPGLLALGVHLLPLNHLDDLGINVTALTDDLLPADHQAYADLAQFNLADLHLWAAEGIAQTCYLTYADQATGLGPELVRMDVHPELGALRWIDSMREWKASQSGPGWGWTRPPGWGHAPPGVGDVKPWTSSSGASENVTVKGLLPGKADTNARDYFIKNAAYYLRPEVDPRSICVYVCSPSFFFRADGRIVLYPMANDGRREMAPSWLAHLPSHPTLGQDRLGVRQRSERAQRPSNPNRLDAEVSRRQSLLRARWRPNGFAQRPILVTF
jgi:hypothetical protein